MFDIRQMVMEDYDEVYSLWQTIRGFGIRTIDDSRLGVELFISRNPTTSIVAREDGRIVGTLLCGHDGRSGCFYHVCVHEAYRKRGIGRQMALVALKELKKEHINKVNLIAFKKNEAGNAFWQHVGATFRSDVNFYEFDLNEENITNFVAAQSIQEA